MTGGVGSFQNTLDDLRSPTDAPITVEIRKMDG